jgi:hypothetical protein
MADTTAITTLANLKLSAEEREQVAGLAGDVIAVQVYRELQKAASLASDSGCNIIGNCSSSCKEALFKS